MIKFVVGPLFLTLFGIVFIYSGAQRVLGAHRETKKGEALLWGTIGILIGIYMLVVVAWLFSLFLETGPAVRS
jgi:hypothetical protein